MIAVSINGYELLFIRRRQKQDFMILHEHLTYVKEIFSLPETNINAL